MNAHHWPSITRRIISSGMTQPELAKACGCAQSSINAVLKGRTKDPRASIALALMRLAAERGVGTEGTPAVLEAAEAPASDVGEVGHAA